MVQRESDQLCSMHQHFCPSAQPPQQLIHMAEADGATKALTARPLRSRRSLPSLGAITCQHCGCQQRPLTESFGNA